MTNEEKGQKFLSYAGEVYGELKAYFDEKYGWEEGLLDDAIIKAHKYVVKYGKEDDSKWKGLIFMTANNLQKDIKRYHHEIPIKEYKNYIMGQQDKEEKEESDMLKSFAVNELLQIVEANFDDITYYCFRVYHLVPGMTYKKLKELTNVADAKQRVVDVNRFLKETLTWNDMVKSFEKY